MSSCGSNSSGHAIFRLPVPLPQQLGQQLGLTAIHLGTRDYMMRAAVRELIAASVAIYNLVPNATEVNRAQRVQRDIPNTRVLSGAVVEAARDRALLAIDSFLYEFRAFLDLMAKFAYGILSGIGKRPAAEQQLSTGRTVNLVDKKGRLRPHDFLLYLCDKLQVPIDWYAFLFSHRNFFTHDATPYCAIEDRLVTPAEYDLLIMRTNILDFTIADPEDYFRVSECRSVITGVRQLGSAVQEHLVDLLA